MNPHFSISFELFPPKTTDAELKLNACAHKLQTLKPEFFSVTFGAGGSTRQGTLATVKRLLEAGLPVAPHLACVGLLKQEILQLLHTYQALGVKRIIALRGDLPSGMGHSGEIKHSDELIALIRESLGKDFQIEVAAYPEIHPQAKSVQADIDTLKRKIEAGANRAITQYFFNPDAYFYFREDCIRAGITVPIIPGIMPINNYDSLKRFSQACGAEIPQWLERRLSSYQNDTARKGFAFEVVARLTETLIKNDAPGLHFYTLNHLQPSFDIVKHLTTLASH